jgi:alkylation response protein AidB-like acyl-CoA dehydrogenase
VALGTAADILAEAERLVPLLDERAREGEDLRTMPRDVVEACAKAGMFKLALPRSLGGLECDPMTIIRVLEKLCYADGSGGWTAMIGNTTSFAAWLDPEVAHELIAIDPDGAAAGLLAPMGRAVPDGDNFRLNGRWPLSSGSPHSVWFCCGVIVFDGEAPRMIDGRPDWRFAFFPASDASIVDTWHVAGLKGTGSNDIVAEDVVVPSSYTASPFFESPHHDGPLYRLPFWSLLMTMAPGIPLGIARRALDEFEKIAPTRGRRGGDPLSSDPSIQIEVAQAEAALRAARALVFETWDEMWTKLTSGESLTMDDRAGISMASLNCMRAGIQAVDIAYHRTGASAIYDSSPLQRCFRDIHTASQHIMMSQEIWKSVGTVVLGGTPDNPMV